MIPLLIFSMATWRIAYMFVKETGPGDVFLKIREGVGIRHDDLKRPFLVPDGFLPGLFSCVWCCSVWVGILWLIIDLLSPWVALRLATAFSFSTGAILIESYLERKP